MSKMIEYKGKRYPCTVSLAMELIGGKWKSVILYHLKDGELRYNELRKEITTITEMTLSLQLKKLEEDGLIERVVYGEKPPVKVVYSLTILGKSFVPALNAINSWGNSVIKNKRKRK